MAIYTRTFSRFTLEIWDRSDIDHIRRNEGICLVITTDNQKNHLTISEDMFDSCKFVPLKGDTHSPRCYICGNGGELERYQYTGFTIHRECQPEFIDKVRDFLEDSSEEVVSKNI